MPHFVDSPNRRALADLEHFVRIFGGHPVYIRPASTLAVLRYIAPADLDPDEEPPIDPEAMEEMRVDLPEGSDIFLAVFAPPRQPKRGRRVRQPDEPGR